MPDQDALDAAMDALEQVVYDAGYEGGFTVGGVNARTAARAAVRKAAREMGREFKVVKAEWGELRYPNVTRMTMELCNPLTLDSQEEYAPGDRVRVTKVEP